MPDARPDWGRGSFRSSYMDGEVMEAGTGRTYYAVGRALSHSIQKVVQRVHQTRHSTYSMVRQSINSIQLNSEIALAVRLPGHVSHFRSSLLLHSTPAVYLQREGYRLLLVMVVVVVQV